MGSGYPWVSARLCCVNRQTSSHPWLAHTTEQSIQFHWKPRVVWLHNDEGWGAVYRSMGDLSSATPLKSPILAWAISAQLYSWSFPIGNFLFISKWDHVPTELQISGKTVKEAVAGISGDSLRTQVSLRECAQTWSLWFLESLLLLKKLVCLPPTSSIAGQVRSWCMIVLGVITGVITRKCNPLRICPH